MKISLFQDAGFGVDSNDSTMDSHVEKLNNISTDELIRKLDYKTKVAIDELLSFSSFTKRILLYLVAITALSTYLTIIKVRNNRRKR